MEKTQTVVRYDVRLDNSEDGHPILMGLSLNELLLTFGAATEAGLIRRVKAHNMKLTKWETQDV